MSQENLTSNKDFESDSAFGYFLDNFNLNRNLAGIKDQLNRNFNINFENEFKVLNAKLVSENLSSTKFDFEEKLTDWKYSWKAKMMAENRFGKMMEVIGAKNTKGQENNFFSNDNIKKIFLEFAENRDKIEDREGKNIKAEDRNKLVDDVLNDNYKILAIYYFAGMLSAKDLDYFLRKLEPMQNVLSKNTDPGWFEKFCFAAKMFFKSFINRNVKKINLDGAVFKLSGDDNRKKKILNSRHESVFDRLRETTVEIGTQNWQQNKVKAKNETKVKNETNEIEKN